MAFKRAVNPGDPRFSENIEKGLTQYALAATVASVSMLASIQPAQSEVIIKNTNIPIRGGLMLDLNNDGKPDLNFTFVFTEGHSDILSYLNVLAFQGGAVMEKGGYASALLRSARIGPSGHFGETAGSQAFEMVEKTCTYYGCRTMGKWVGNHPNRFVGVKFKISGKTHYGWVRVTVDVNTNSKMTATITEYGYETIANRPVKAGLPSSNVTASSESISGASAGSLGLLALGADGLTIWRREDNSFCCAA
ncbi:MAG TPA: hypothetical protein VHW45_12805 [Candidatus Sulfotelmatobacter sp.]|jgi:hypothetical protein|nr:hypothetical protein [Candidatus Sulfotelmatobacter sp.]